MLSRFVVVSAAHSSASAERSAVAVANVEGIGLSIVDTATAVVAEGAAPWGTWVVAVRWGVACRVVVGITTVIVIVAPWSVAGIAVKRHGFG